jgi:DNA polymerase III subunit delta'
MLFKEVIGNTELKSQLIHTIQSKRISHAQLFLEKEGSGGFVLALAYVRYILCESKEEEDACGTCRNCIRMDKLEHPDVHFSFPIHASKTDKIFSSDDVLPVFRNLVKTNPYFGLEDWYHELGNSNKQGNIPVEEAHLISKKLSLKAFEGGYKVLIMWLPEFMKAAASNNLLKLLEEPPPKTLFILVSQHADNIISTILSRTQIIRILPPKTDEIKSFLVSKYNLSESEAENSAHLSERNITEAIRLSKQSDTSSFNIENFVQWMRICYKRSVPDTIIWVEQIAKSGRETQKSFLKFCLQMFRNSIVGHYTQGQTVVMTNDQKAFLEKFSPYINHNNIVLLSKAIDDAHYHIERNANPKILFMDLSLKIFLQLKKA